MNRGSRRNFLKTGLVMAGGAGLGLAALRGLNLRGTNADSPTGLSPLRPVKDAYTGLPLLMLPEGFRYRTFGWAGAPMDDGYPGPARVDGMGVVSESNGLVTMIRNHELRGSSGPIGNPATAWDNTGGGTTSVVFNTRSERPESLAVSLNGTLNNCAGGVTPWGTWLSCEEAPFNPELLHLGIQLRQRHWQIEQAQRPHGYVFEVDPARPGRAEPITQMGQFWHEAATVDESSGYVYQTEDHSPHAGLYRYIPDAPGDLAQGGRLQMMRVADRTEMNLDVAPFEWFDTGWVDIENPEQGHTPGTHDGSGVVTQGMAAGGTAFKALEGCFIHGNDLFFTSKSGGASGLGQVFHFDVEQSRIRLIWEGHDETRFAMPDNLVVSQQGHLVVCEDNETGAKQGQHIVHLDPGGGLHPLCRVNPEISGEFAGHDLGATAPRSEWAGACFTADGAWMFANLYRPGFSCAITGPWEALWAGV